MKKLLLLFVTVVFLGEMLFSLTLGDVVDKNILLKKGYSANMVTIMEDKNSGKKREMSMNIYNKGDNSRVEMVLTSKMVGNPQQYMQLKMMGMDKQIIISKKDNKYQYSYMIYPKNEAYVEMKRSISDKEKGRGASTFDMDTEEQLKANVVKVGSGKIEGISAVKYELKNKDGADKNMKTYFYVANKMVVGVEMIGEKGTTKMVFKNIKVGVPNSKFNLPRGYTKYDNMQQMAQDIMQNMQ